jgi:hypothetical protein
LGILLSSPLAWLGLAHLGALAALFVTEFWTTDVLVVSWSLSNFATLFRDAVYRAVTVGVAAVVTVVDTPDRLSMAFAIHLALGDPVRTAPGDQRAVPARDDRHVSVLIGAKDRSSFPFQGVQDQLAGMSERIAGADADHRDPRMHAFQEAR